MAIAKCEFCGFDQDTDKSVICDNCGMRVVRAKTVPKTEKKAEPQSETVRCHNCGVPTTKSICNNCGAAVRRT